MKGNCAECCRRWVCEIDPSDCNEWPDPVPVTNADRIIDYMSNEKVQSLRDENQALRLAASQERQNQYLISQLGYQCPKPAYVVQPPQQVTFPTNCCGGVNYASYNNGCGCGC